MPTLLITVDSLRADHLGQYGYERNTMPALDRVAENGTVFTQAFSNGPYTRVSIPTIHTSRYLSYGDLDAFSTIASILNSNGITTAAIGTQTGINLVQGDFDFEFMADLGRDGFEEQTDRSASEETLLRIDDVAASVSERLQQNKLDSLYEPLQGVYNTIFKDQDFERVRGYTKAEIVTDEAISYIQEHSDEEFFLWVHYMEAHRPYGIHDEAPDYLAEPMGGDKIYDLMKKAGTEPDQVTESERQLMIDLYDSDITYCSRHLSRLFDALESEGLWDRSDIFFSSDHGEEFREHGLFFHRNYPYDELTNVPLIVKSAKEDQPSIIKEQRELLDLAPTIVSDFGLDGEEFGMLGNSLFEESSRDVISMGQPGMDIPAVAIRSNGWKYIHTEEGNQLYNLEKDAAEQTNVYKENHPEAQRLKRKIPSRLLSRDTKLPRPPEDSVDRQQLDALGYMEIRGTE